MQIELGVHNSNVDKALSIHGIEFSHVGCGPVSHSKEYETGRHRLTCGCGLEIRFDLHDVASSVIIDVTIDEDPRDLPIGSYSSSPKAVVRVVPRYAA